MPKERKMKHIFILNGTISNHPFIDVIKDVMRDYDYEIILTKSEEHALEVSHSLKGNDRIYSVGGDGLLNKVIQGIANTDNELVIIPYGTGNDFHRYLSQQKDCRQVLIDSLKKTSSYCDLALLNNHYYINSACFGLDSIIANKVHVGIHIPFIPDYVLAIIKNVLTYKNRHIKIYDDEHIYYDDKMLLCTINNGQYYGGGFMITPSAKIDDGYLNLCVVDGMSKIKIPYMLSLLLKKEHMKRKEVHHYLVKDLKIDCEYSCNIDGDEVKYEHYEIHIVPNAIRIVY